MEEKANVSLWKNKNFTLTFLGALVSNIGAVLYSFAVSFYILKITNNNAVIQGAYLTVVGVTAVIVILFGGVLADRYNKAKIMYLCDYMKGILLVITALILLFAKNTTFILVMLFVVGIIGTIFSSIFSPASSALIPLIVKEDQLQQANSYNSMLQSVQTIVGVLLAGILYSLLPIAALFFVVAGCYLASGLSEMFIRYNYEKSTDTLTMKKTFIDLGSSFKYIFTNKTLFYFLLSILFINFFFNPLYSNFLPFFVANDVAPSEYLFKSVMSAEMWQSIFELLSGIGMIVGSIVISVIHYKKASTPGRIGLAIISALLLAISLTYYFLVSKNQNVNPELIIMSIGMLLVGFIIPIINVPINTTLQKITDKEKLGKVNATMQVCSMGLTPLATLIAGFVISGAGSVALLFVCAGGFVVTTIFYIFNKHISKL